MQLIINKTLKYFIISFIVIITLGFAFKGVITRAIFKYEAKKIQNNYNLNVKANTIEFTGIRTVRFNNLSISTLNSDTLVNFGEFKTKLSLLNILTLSINPLEITINNSSLNIHNIIKYRNSISCTNQNPNTAIKVTNQSLAKYNKVIKSFFGLSTARFNVDSFSVKYIDTLYSSQMLIQSWKYKGNEFNAIAFLKDNDGEQQLCIKGFTNKKLNKIELEVSGINGRAKIPFIEPFLGISTFFNSAIFQIKAEKLSNSKIDLALNAQVKQLQLQGKRISEIPIITDSVSANLIFSIKPQSYSIDSISTVTFNKLKGNIGIYYNMLPDSTLNFKFSIAEHSWQNLIESLPSGLFNNLRGMKVGGSFKYSLNIKLNPNNPDSIKIDPNIYTSKFYIQSYGNTNFSALNDTFTHKVYNDGTYIKSIYIGDSNKTYTALSNISPYLRWAIITSEDGSFYNHRGFDLDGIRYAMACNIKEKRFARGGSTISQQLIKNLYLNQNKNITRKFEEILIVWMIENGQIVSKDRLLEIYLNIIEWGPNIYGVNEACKYYFNKKPSEITLREALFLAYIIPRPTKFKYVFEDESHLKSFMYNNFEFVSNKMLARSYITNDDYNSILSIDEFTLAGDAKKMLNKDIAATDSTEIIDFLD